MNDKLTSLEWKSFDEIMEYALERMSCAGCNDLEIPNSTEGMALAKAFLAAADSPEYAEWWAKDNAGEKALIVSDMQMLRHLIEKLKS